jgi:hypothetical protein
MSTCYRSTGGEKVVRSVGWPSRVLVAFLKRNILFIWRSSMVESTSCALSISPSPSK